MTSKVYVVLVNWNNWVDTLECLESVFQSDYPRFQVIVCDNASTDGSMDRVKAWAEGRLDAQIKPGSPVARLSPFPSRRPMRYLERDRQATGKMSQGETGDCPLILIQTGENLGFAGGNNVALKYVLGRGDADFVWLLNNDTVVAPDALTQLVATLEAKSHAGQCGSTILFYDQPGKVQVCGGCRYNSWWGSVNALGLGRLASDLPDADYVERNMDYVAGASLLARVGFVKDVGLLSEDYFLYFEEIDWATRGKDQYNLAYAPNSRVYHKEGRTTGSSSDPAVRTTTAELDLIRSRISYTRKFRPWALPTVCLAFAGVLWNRVRRGQWNRVVPMVKVATRSLVKKLDTS